MQTIIEQFLTEQEVKATCFVTDGGASIHVNYELADGVRATNHITIKNRHLHVSTWNSLGNSMMDIVDRFQNGVSGEMEEVFLVMLKLWGVLLKQQEIDVFTLQFDTERFGKSAHETLKQRGLKQLDSAQKKFIAGHFHQEASWLLYFQENEIVKGLQLGTHLSLFLQQKQQEDLTMVINWEMEKSLLHLYYRGHHETFQTLVESGQLILKSGATELIMSDKETVKTELEEWFCAIEASELETTLYFDDFIKEAYVRTNRATYLHEELRAHYTVWDIETYAAKWLKGIHETKKTVLHQDEMVLFRFLNHSVFMDYDADEITLFEQEKQAATCFKERALKKYQQKLQEKLDGFIQAANPL